MSSTMVKGELPENTTDYRVSSSYLTILKRHLSLMQGGPSSDMATFEALDTFTIRINEVESVLAQIERICGRANFGLDVGRNMHPSDYGIFAYAMMNCESLLEALRTAAQHKIILNQKLFADFIEAGDEFAYQVNTSLDSKASQILIELDFSTAYEFAKRLVGPSAGEGVKLRSVHFTHQALGPIEDYSACFSCPVYFGSEYNRICIARDELSRPIYGANPLVLSALKEKIAMVASCYEETQALSLRVARYLRKNLSHDMPSAHQAAAEFYLSLSSFKKRLSDEGTCYQNICEEVRLKRCLELINKDRFALKEIAYELGFSNASAFNRAFKRWTGKSPSDYKKTQALLLAG